MMKKVTCPYCFERFLLEIFPEDGESQDIIYDCEVCCHPIEIKATWDEGQRKMLLITNKSSGFN